MSDDNTTPMAADPAAEKLFASLAESASKLNTASESCNCKIKDYQERLAKLHLGLTFWFDDQPLLDLEDGEKEDEQLAELIGFAQVGGSWILAHKTVIQRPSADPYADLPDSEDYSNPQPLLSASREIRLAPCKAMNDFLQAYNAFAQEKFKAQV